MRLKNCHCELIFLFLTNLKFTISRAEISSPEISAKSGITHNNLSIHQQQQQQQQQQKSKDLQNAQLNTLNAYASNYDAISNRQNQNDKFKPSYKIPEMETNFTPIRNGNSIAPEFVSSLGTHAPVLMQYLPQAINEGGVQYLQLIPSRPLIVPIGSYLTGNTGVQSLAYHQHVSPSNSIDYATRPILSPLPINMPPPAPSSIVDVPASPLPAYGIQSYAGSNSPYKQNHRINRETKDKQLLGPLNLNLNLNEYIPHFNSHHQHAAFNMQARS